MWVQRKVGLSLVSPRKEEKFAGGGKAGDVSRMIAEGQKKKKRGVRKAWRVKEARSHRGKELKEGATTKKE